LSPMLSVHSVTYLSGSDTGTFSPYSDGEKKLDATSPPSLATLKIGETIDDSVPLPVSIRGEDAGRQVRGSANARKRS
ncbi:hypothetical protein, partial [Mesorhizobium sp.]|uniref:hypothetical protein n=1 Tax=Mesorhizobium sp. TaxID=1871066 RepID=UPI0025C69BE4